MQELFGRDLGFDNILIHCLQRLAKFLADQDIATVIVAIFHKRALLIK